MSGVGWAGDIFVASRFFTLGETPGRRRGELVRADGSGQGGCHDDRPGGEEAKLGVAGGMGSNELPWLPVRWQPPLGTLSPPPASLGSPPRRGLCHPFSASPAQMLRREAPRRGDPVCLVQGVRLGPFLQPGGGAGVQALSGPASPSNGSAHLADSEKRGFSPIVQRFISSQTEMRWGEGAA